jgi:mRNA-degrading endonuclease RelE of RelBE toxin-antitoxin system
MSYLIQFTEQAEEDTARLKKSETAAYNKLQKLLMELIEHPRIDFTVLLPNWFTSVSRLNLCLFYNKSIKI